MNIATTSCESLADNIRANFPTKRPNSVLALMGFVIACQQTGIRGARLLFGLNDSQFYRLKADARRLKQDTKSPFFAALGTVKSQLNEFIPLIKQDIVNENLLEEGGKHV